MKYIKVLAAVLSAMILFSCIAPASAREGEAPAKTTAVSQQRPKSSDTGVLAVTALAVLSSGAVHLVRTAAAKRSAKNRF